MIQKFKEIVNLGVFQNFEWDKSVKDKDGNILEFKQINIFYGRNYSGKTTLSRILRAIETGNISDKFENPDFCVAFADNSEIKQDNLNGHEKKIRVFNDDFVRDNLKFIINPDEHIEPFAILGGDNNRIENEIKAIEVVVGSNAQGSETGLYAQLKQENVNLTTVQGNHQSRNGHLNSQLTSKATGRDVGIKYQLQRFNEPNYNIKRLTTDIESVLDDSFDSITKEREFELEKLIEEKINSPIQSVPGIILNLNRFNTNANALITQEVGESDKIQDLVKDAILNKWVKEGRQLHKDKRKNCAFCDNPISSNRWSELEKHFDEESEQLEKSLDKLIVEVNADITSVIAAFKPDKNLFYTRFHSQIERFTLLLDYVIGKYVEQLDDLREQLTERKNDILNSKKFTEKNNYQKRVEWALAIYENLRKESNAYSSELNQDQTKARTALRLKEVHDFVITIKYKEEIEAIAELFQKVTEATGKRDNVNAEIIGKNEEIESKKRELKDESKGADRVNDYLNNFFGHGFLSLRAVEFLTEGDNPIKKFRFEVIRDNKKAYHLSEGECSLIGFCYFLAKLDDIETKGQKPIIWIDDPISSLDGNHIFFVYSILNSEIVAKNIFEQLFISTHNLDFLKYLKRLAGHFANPSGNSQEYSKCYFVINRQDRIASISLMPKYLKEFVTEFNYLFHQIFKCSKIAIIDDTNYTTFYNFGNNARKFLEVYLYYKYPDDGDEIKKLQKFFGGEKIPSVFTDRINNEYSHLAAVFERGAVPVEVPEMKSAAELIIKRIKESDVEQYNSLLVSIGETP